MRRIETVDDLRPGDHLYIEGMYANARQDAVIYVRRLKSGWHRVAYERGMFGSHGIPFSIRSEALRLSRARRGS